MTAVPEELDIDKIVAADLPKFQECLKEIKEHSDLITQDVRHLTEKIENGELPTSDGISLLDVKNQTFLTYLSNLVAIVSSKVNGESIKDSESVKTAVESRIVLEKIRPLELKLKYQIDNLLKSATESNAQAKTDTHQFKPNVDNFGSSDSCESEDGEKDDEVKNGTKKYVPPHIAAVKLDEGGKESQAEKQRQHALTKSSIISELVSEATDTPSEISHHPQLHSRTVKDREDRKRYEEEYFTRVNVPKKQRMAEKHMLRKSELATLANFGKVDFLHGASSNVPKRKSKNNKKSLKSKKKKFRK
ncbi:neuroguidin-like [Clavelina lepadiformis]|uniref:Neuroguidin n=1 Tax=Clavelina lepadiformis TaxID=159417 RepID=A0ABP0FWV9_CLALP